MQNRRFNIWFIIIALLVGAGLLFVPLLGDFHFESALLASFVGCFWAGIKACKSEQSLRDFHSALMVLGFLYLAGMPLLLFALVTGCFSIHGLAFWLLYPLPSVFLGYAIGRLFRKWQLPARRTLTVVILLCIGIGIFIYEFFNYPQVYFFNHIWGGWPGPIYDETVTIDGATFFFRSMTLLWALLLWHIPSINKERISLWIVGLTTIALGFAYTQLAEMGIIAPNEHLQSVLGGSRETPHFNIYYDREFYSEYEIDMLAREHEFYLNQIADEIALEKPDSSHKIESYLYANPWQKKRLVGAKFTSYVPVWLTQDQLHIAKQQITGSLKHELVHIAAKQFGNSLFNASWSIGLIEGLAVAIDGGDSQTTTIDQIVASQKPYPKVEDLQRSFSFWGFYGGRSGVNYTTSGSFIRYLLDRYPVEYIKEAYRTGNIGEQYPQSWEDLTSGWYQHLDSVTVDSIDQRQARRIFSIPSLFEQPCPHVESNFTAAWDDYQYYRTIRDSTKALQSLNKVLAISDSLPSIKEEWSFRNLEAGQSATVRHAASLKDSSVTLQLLFADAFKLDGDTEQAQHHLQKARILSAQLDSIHQSAVQMRLDDYQWHMYNQLVYDDQLPDTTAFRQAVYRTKIRGLRASIEQEKWRTMTHYAKQLIQEQPREKYFSDYLVLIHHLTFQDKRAFAKDWIQKLDNMPLRDRYRERLDQEIGWLSFNP